MRSAGNFHPEWGYLAPAPSFVRTVRTAIVSAAVGAIAGAGVVLSLLDQPADLDVATHTLAAPVVAAASAPVSSESVMPSNASETPPRDGAAAKPVAETEEVAQTASTAAPPEPGDPSASKKAVAKKPRVAPLYASRGMYGAAGGLYMNGAGHYRSDRWSGYQDRERRYYDR